MRDCNGMNTYSGQYKKTSRDLKKNIEDMPKKDDPKSIGKRNELIVIAKLLEHCFDVYYQQVQMNVDCIIKLDENCYIDIEIKSTSSINNVNPHRFNGPSKRNRRNNLYYIFYVERDDDFFIIPSSEIVSKLDMKKERWQKYKNDEGFKLLKNYKLTCD